MIKMPATSAAALKKKRESHKRAKRRARLNIKNNPKLRRRLLEIDRERKRKTDALHRQENEKLKKENAKLKAGNECLLQRLVRQKETALRGWRTAAADKAETKKWQTWWRNLPVAVKTKVLGNGIRANHKKAVWDVNKERWVSPSYWDPGLKGEGRQT